MERISLMGRALRYPLRSHPRRFWLVTLTLATAVALSVTSTVVDAKRVSTELGGRQSVVIARHSLEVGTVVSSEDLRHQERSIGWLPNGAAPSIAEVVGSTVIADIAANEVVVLSRIASSADAAGAELAGGERGVAISMPAGFDFKAGTTVELIIAASGNGSPAVSSAADSQGGAAAIAGRVIAIDEAVSSSSNRWATIAVAASDAPAAAEAERANQLTLVLAPTPSPD